MKHRLGFLVKVSLASLPFAVTAIAQSIHLNAGAIDTRQPAILAMARSASADFPGSRLHLVQFDGPIQPEWLAQLTADGYRIVDYVPDNAYLVYGPAPALQALRSRARNVRWEGAYLADDKIQPRVRALTPKPGQLYAVQLVLDESANVGTLARIEVLKLAPIRSATPNPRLGFLNVIVALPADCLTELAGRADVVSVNMYEFPSRRCERQGQIVAGNTNADGSQPSGVGYLAWLASKGFEQAQFEASGFVVDIADDGWDNGVAATPANREFRAGGDSALASRVKYSRKGTTLLATGSHGADGHGNINVSIVGGYNNLSGSPYVDAAGYHRGLGICPFVNLGNTKVFEDGGTWGPTASQEAAYVATNYAGGVRISSNSWGLPGDGDYNVDSQNYDTWTRDSQPGVAGNQQVLYVFAAGNDGPGATTIGAPGTGKNILSVGAAENYNLFGTDGCGIGDTGANNANDIIGFSSRGPCTDQRIKPDLVAPGTHVNGAASFYSGYTGDGVCDKFQPVGQTNYAASSGTSHSTPAVAGGAALVYQYFLNRGWGTPSPAMIKAYLMNSARYLTGVDANDTLPSADQGMGMMNLGTAFDGADRILRDQLTNDLFTASGQSRLFYGWVADTNQTLRVTLAWTDAPGSTTGNAYKNNLNLVVMVGGVSYKGNVFSGAHSTTGGTADVRNNVESVFLPAGVTGVVQVTVSAANITSDGVPNFGGSLDQDFALVSVNATALTAPIITVAGGTNQYALIGSELSFGVTASDADNDIVTLASVSVPAGSVFVETQGPAPVQSTFTWTPSATGTYTAVFVANDSQTAVTQAVSIAVEAPVLPLLAPVIQPASDIERQRFNANWSVSDNATGYWLDVSTNGSFSGTGGGSVLSEDFSLFIRTNSSTDVSSNLDPYTQDPGWTGSRIYEDNGKAKVGSSKALGYITTPTVNLSGNDGAATLTFDLGQYGTDVGLVQVLHAPNGTTFSQVGSDLTPPSGLATQTLEITGGTVSSKIRITAKSFSKNRFYLDNVQIVSGGEGGFVPGYQQRDVGSATTCVVTGLTEGVTYFYRAKAYHTTSNSPYSSVTSVVTMASAPGLNPIGARDAFLGESLQFQVTATSTEGDPVTLTVTNLPSGAEFYPTNEVGYFVWNNASPTGDYSVTFTAADDDGTSSEAVAIHVHALPEIGAVNLAPDMPATVTVQSVAGQVYRLEYTTDLVTVPVVWTLADSETGTGGPITLSDPAPTGERRFYRLAIP